MSIKTKAVLVFLILIASLSVFAFFNSAVYVSSFANLSLAVPTPLPNPDADPDHDGLTNVEEMIWLTDPFNPDTDKDGFLDGEEVASGHNPLVPGPNDLLPTTNITEKTSTLMTSAFYAGALNKDADNVTYGTALADITNSIVADSNKALDPDNIPVGPIISSSDSKDAQEKYVNAIGSIIENDLWGELINEPRVATMKFANFNADDPQNINATQQYFNAKAGRYQELITKLNALAVPPAWLDIHRQLLTGLRTLVVNHQALGQIGKDPMKGITAINNLMTLYQEVQPTLVTIVQKIKKNNLKPPDGQLWALITSLTNGL